MPGDHDLLVEVHAATVNRTDCGFRKASPFIVRIFSGLARPKHRVLGTEFAGEVVSRGGAVTQFAVGDQVFGANVDRFGAHAEFVCVNEDAPVTRMSTNTTFVEAAAVCDGALLALAYLRKADVGSGTRVLVYGASGSIGTAAVQLAKQVGAEVTAVCDAKGSDVVRSLGADKVVDYALEDFTAQGDTYDVIFDAVGKTSFRRCRRAMAPSAVYMSTELGFLCQNPILPLLTRLTRRRRVFFPIPRFTKTDVLYVKELMDAGTTAP